MSRDNISIFVSLRANTERNLMKFEVGNRYDQQVNLLHFERNWTRDKGNGMQDTTENSNRRQTGAATGECGGIM